MPLPKTTIEQDLPVRAQQGDENALAALIARMMPAIRSGAAACTAPGLDFEDAVQEGLIGLFHAVRGSMLPAARLSPPMRRPASATPSRTPAKPRCAKSTRR